MVCVRSMLDRAQPCMRESDNSPARVAVNRVWGGRPRQRKLVKNGPARCKSRRAEPVRAASTSDRGLRHSVRRRREAAFYHLARVALGRRRAVSLPRALAIADRAGDLTYSALPGLRRLALAARRDRLRRHALGRARARRLRAARIAAPRAVSSSWPNSTTFARTSMSTRRSTVGSTSRRSAPSVAAASSSPATSATGSCSPPTSRAGPPDRRQRPAHPTTRASTSS